MPQIFSNSIPVVPAAPAAAAAALVPGAPAVDFLGQFKAALKNLTKAVIQPRVDQPLTQEATATVLAGAEPAPTDTSPKLPVDHNADTLPEILAAFGFIQVPIAFQPQAPVPVKVTDGPAPSTPEGAAGAGAAPADPRWMQPLPKSSPAESSPPAPMPTTGEAQVHPEVLLELSKLPRAEVQLPMLEGQLAPLQSAAAQHAPTPHVVPPADAPVAVTPAATPVSTDPSTMVSGVPVSTPPLVTAGSHAPTPVAVADVTIQVLGSQHNAHPGSFHQGNTNDDGREPTSKKTTPVADGAPVQGAPTVAMDQAIAAAAGATAPTNVVALPPHVRPAEVVSQIAHQADLYRLPGNRGVRIQLHPEGLGGVEVTMRYGVGGALQLHINVEHAATGALVQAGWTQLRDALVTQGISPDRLVMSVNAPNGSSQFNFSGGGSGRQSEPDLAGFAQNPSGQQRQDNPDQTGPRGRNNDALDPTSPSADSPRVASTTAVTSRIDYRA